MGPLSPLRVFIDADVYYAAALSDRGASRVVLRLGEFRLLSLATSELAKMEAHRNLEEDVPDAVSIYDALLAATHTVILPMPSPEQTETYLAYAHPKDAPHLACAIERGYRFFLTFNARHYSPPADLISVLTPGQFLELLRLEWALLDVPSPS